MKQDASWFDALDRLRRLQGNALDHVGLGPVESPYRLVCSRPGFRLRCYTEDVADGPPLLIVPAPIKRPYIWDLSPERSVVQQAIDRGLAVYLVEWAEPNGADDFPGLEAYAGAMLDSCLEEIEQASGRDRIFLTGHSLGGILAALYTAYQPARVAALALIDAPLHFAPGAEMPDRSQNGHAMRAQEVLASSSRIPGSLLSMISANSAPETFYTSRYLDYLASMGSRRQMQTHLRVQRWTMDELAMPRRLFEDVVEQLYRGNGFMRGDIVINGRKLHPRQITAPLFSVFEPASKLIPAASAKAFFNAVGSRNKELMAYPGDTGVALQHVGPLVGDNAHQLVWPRILDWLDDLR